MKRIECLFESSRGRTTKMLKERWKKRFTMLKIVLFMFVLFLHPRTKGQVVPLVPIPPFAPRPLCSYQMALANQACAYLPFIQIPPPAPRAPFGPPAPPSDDEDTPEHEHMHDHGHSHLHDEDHDHDNDDDRDGDGDRDHKNGHEQKRHHHHHHHHHHHRHKETPVEEQCCKWLSQVDDQCVCELLVHMPPFLARPVHKYSVIVGKACNITYSCGSRIRN
ncbi:hypothetical protein L1987_21866 [Smallanthus sonchifolius]|uniref:Uncharacterized protein n=1 Tax=Smallanthus sonchifolius TaxID=185202 RepID=A0ACB9IE81_9ASTR|nr:hypothetical protein L1987_21866 [Smallanthus sonchifolius]